jgi:2'-5' RNA ligase
MIPTLHGLSPQETSRPKAGDICILLAPDYEQATHLRQRINHLQEEFKGLLNPTPYLQLQRFRITKETLDALQPSLKQVAQHITPMAIQAKSLEPFYSTLREQELLKCRIDITEVYKLYDLLMQTLLEANISPLELDLSTHITMLENIKMIRLEPKRYEELLFTAQRLLVVKLKGPGFYTALFSLPLAGCKFEEALTEQGHL